MSADFSAAMRAIVGGIVAHADRDGLTGVKRAVFIDRGGHVPGEACPSAEPSPHDPHEYWCAAPVPGQPDDGEPCTCGAGARVIPPASTEETR